MTLKLPELDRFDKILISLGKKRGVHYNSEILRKFPYSIVMAKKEPFITALLRPKNKPLPNGMMDLYKFQWKDDEDFEKNE